MKSTGPIKQWFRNNPNKEMPTKYKKKKKKSQNKKESSDSEVDTETDDPCSDDDSSFLSVG
eukprot:CAMPEP_0196825700 /NCGR_PEP_ID=MMETSP1362-20130617/93213_1 /TAXON_ID=163516 /ORGANISM="Leptocylindrus danicus, Strain CCMP1856" /LENGTH=60 /DNA_ID=CAMNT_0042206181 /DNA_START=635 /DNA_END=817 /DNA_ORIENTATION=-